MSQVTNVSFSLEFKGGHDAMVSDPQAEVCRILSVIKQKILDGHDDGTVYDANGNNIGEWYFGIELDDSDEDGEDE